MGLVDRLRSASHSAAGTLVLVSANPIHDTGGGQRSAQMALEFLRRDWRVVFASDGEVTETVDLGLRYPQRRLVRTTLSDLVRRLRSGELGPEPLGASPLLISQVPVRASLRLQWWMEGRGTRVYDCVDRWDSELGGGWYRRSVERRVAHASDLLVASAPVLVAHLEGLTGHPARLLPNAYNRRIFHPSAAPRRPADLPDGPVALYVGALWGGWMDWGLVAHLARRLPGIRFVFVGDHRGEGDDLPDNCHFLGLKPQVELPGYLAHARVGFLPWKRNEVTRATSPLKVYEYLAMGLPVVAPALEPLAGLPGVAPAADTESFTAAMERTARDGPGADTLRSMEEFAEENSWHRRAETLLAWVGDRPVPERPPLPTRLWRSARDLLRW